MEIIIASKNEGKIKEIKKLLPLPQVKWLTYKELPNWPKLKESGQTYTENATIKALTLAKKYQKPALGEDSGLEVAALNGQPGLRSARYAGEKAGAADNIKLLLKNLSQVPPNKRQAQFVAVAVLAFPDGRLIKTKGVCRGQISLKPAGKSGFGYDPVFIPEGYQKTLAELGVEEKNKLSHRAKALKQLEQYLRQLVSS